MGNIKLSQAVAYALDDMNAGDAEYARAYRFAVRALDEIRLDITGIIHIAKLCVNSDLTVDLPDDFIRETKIGIFGEKGNIIGLTRSDNLNRLENATEGVEESNPHYFDTDEAFGNFVNQSLGKGSYTNVGFYNISYGERKIYLDADFTHSEIALEYLKREEQDGEYCVDERLLEAVAAYILYRWYKAKKGASVGERREFERLWHKEKRNAKFRIKKPMLQNMNQSARESVKAGLKS